MASYSREDHRRTRPEVAPVCLQALCNSPTDPELLEAFCNLRHHRDLDECWDIEAFWEAERSHLEVRHPGVEPSVRIYSEDRKLILCRYFWKCFKGVDCYYAHTVKELLAWRDQKKRRTSSGQNDSSWPDLNFPSSSLPIQGELQTPSSHTHDNLMASRKSHYRQRRVEADINVVSDALTRNNYKKKFTSLLSLERKAREERLHVICNGNFFFHKIQEEDVPYLGKSENFTSYGYVSGMNGDVINYASRESNSVQVATKHHRINGSILTCNLKNKDDKFYIGFKDNYDGGNENVSLKFWYKDSYFDNLSQMVSELDEHMIARILPEPSDFSGKSKVVEIDRYFAHLSREQTEAFKAIVSKGKGMPPVLLTGAFGCGKTHVLAKSAVYFLNKDSDFEKVHILICTQQNVSANNFLKLFHQIQVKKDPDLYLVRVVRLHHVVHDHSIDQKEFKTIEELNPRNFVGKMKVLVITTCSTSFIALKKSIFPEEYFTHVLLDECAQMREPEAIAPLCLAAHNAKLAMAGDFKQVGPSTLVIGDLPRQNGLAVSLVERLHNLYKRSENVTSGFLSELRENYRCHKKIVEFCSYHFYDDLSMTSIVPGERGFPFHFVCSDMELRTDLTSHNRIYEDEAEIMVQQLAKVYEYWPKETWGQEKDCSQIVTAASTRSQLAEIERKLGAYSKDLMKTSRVPTDDIQGKEYRVVIIGTSEPTPKNGQSLSMTDSICNPQVFNTVISRARSLVIVVGNPMALLCKEKCIHGSKEGFWESYLKKCLDHGTFESEHVKQNTPHIHGLLNDALKGILQRGKKQVSSQTKVDEIHDNNKDPYAN